MNQPRTFTCDAVLFDLDGVLIDSAAVVERHWRQWAMGHGLDPEVVLAVSHGRPTIETIQEVAPHLDAVAEGRACEAVGGADTDGLIVVAGARALVEAMPRDRWAVVTSGNHQTATTRLHFGGYPIPNVFITADRVTRGKPDPEGYLRAAKHLGMDPTRCLVFEDAPAGIAAAQAAGMQVIGVATTFAANKLHAADCVVPSLSPVKLVSTSPSLTLQVG